MRWERYMAATARWAAVGSTPFGHRSARRPQRRRQCSSKRAAKIRSLRTVPFFAKESLMVVGETLGTLKVRDGAENGAFILHPTHANFSMHHGTLGTQTKS